MAPRIHADARRQADCPAMTPALATPLACLPAEAGPLLQTPSPTCVKDAAATPCSHAHADHKPIAHAHPEPLKPLLAGDRVLAGLLRENDAFVRGDAKAHAGVPSLRTHLATHGQTPTTCVVACADSRVAPEILFRAGLGELFVIRAAGNTTWGDEVLGSLEYAVDHLNVSLVMVLGHSKCGAVGAAVAGGDPLPGALGRHITGICKGIEAHGGCGDGAAVAVERNVAASVAFLRKDADGCAAAAERAGRVRIVGAVYDIEDGRVRVLEGGKQEAGAARRPRPRRRAGRGLRRVAGWAAATLPRLACASVLLFNVLKCMKGEQCAAIEA